MKKLITLIISSASVLGAFGQEKENDGDTLKIKWKQSCIWVFENPDAKKDEADTTKKLSKHDKKDFAHWGGIDLGISMLSTVDNKLMIPEGEDSLQMNTFLDLNYGKSLFFSLNLFEKNIRLYKNYVNLVTGLGFEWNSYNFKRNITLDHDADYISASNTVTAPEGVTFSKNKLKAAFIKAPLLLEFNTNNENPHKSFHIAGGMEFGYKLGSKTKQVYEINGYEYKVKQKSDYNLSDIKYSSTIRIGYGDYFTVFANYGLSQLFEKDKGPDVYPITAGLSFNF